VEIVYEDLSSVPTADVLEYFVFTLCLTCTSMLGEGEEDLHSVLLIGWF
jgi:uncharacterized protein YuzB (UPF0349 family)